MTDILDRLRAAGPAHYGAKSVSEHGSWCQWVEELLRDAIAAIEQRDAEIARLREGLTALKRTPADRLEGGCCYQTHLEGWNAALDAALAAQREETT